MARHVLRTAVIATAVSLVSCASAPQPAPTVTGGCAPGIEYQGRSLNLEATWRLLGLGIASDLKAVREVSDLLQIYLQESASLCDLHAAGKLSAAEYADRRAGIALRFAGLVRLSGQMPPGEVPDAEAPLYAEALSALRPGAEAREMTLKVGVTSGGRAVESGRVLRSGDSFRITVDVPVRSYIYVVLLDSSNAVSRLYPASLTGSENPVIGTIEIPRSGEREFVLDNRTGRERIFVFAQASRSVSIEGLLAEIGGAGQSSPAVAMALTRGVRVREKLSATSVVKGPKDPSTAAVTAAFGQAAYEFVIEHR